MLVELEKAKPFNELNINQKINEKGNGETFCKRRGYKADIRWTYYQMQHGAFVNYEGLYTN